MARFRIDTDHVVMVDNQGRERSFSVGRSKIIFEMIDDSVLPVFPCLLDYGTECLTVPDGSIESLLATIKREHKRHQKQLKAEQRLPWVIVDFTFHCRHCGASCAPDVAALPGYLTDALRAAWRVKHSTCKGE